MAHIIYDNDRPSHYNSTGNNGFRPNGGYALLAIIIVFVLFFGIDPGWLRINFNNWQQSNRNSMLQPVEGSRMRLMTDIRHVTVDSLNLREQPSNDGQVSYILPRGTSVAILGQSHRALDGGVWLKVNVESLEGIRVGWVSQQYIE